MTVEVQEVVSVGRCGFVPQSCLALWDGDIRGAKQLCPSWYLYKLAHTSLKLIRLIASNVIQFT